ncbi:MAG: Rieske (2Fe-2S) protein [Planctomycetales bacterium]|nr:Rieske (2Fe-2S) protein [Planctomycetales bacterium]
MAEWVRVASIHDVPAGSAKEVMAGERVVALFNVDGQFHAMDGVCPHAGGPLGEGIVSGTTVTCPWHGWQFDVTSGKHCLNQRITHTTYPAKVENDEVFVEV